MTGPSPASHCHCRCHVIGQVIARGKECIQFVFESTTAYLRNCLLKEEHFQEIPKITFFQCPKVAPLFTPYMGMCPMLLYFIQNLRVHTFTTYNIIMIGPAIPELKYVHKIRWTDGHGVIRATLGHTVDITSQSSRKK